MSTTEADFTAYYREHYPVVARYVERRIDDRETARELAADVFRVTWLKHADRPLPDRGWLLVTARNLLGNEYRRRGRSRAIEERAAATALTSAAVAEQDDRDLALAVLDGLDHRHREVLQLAYWDQLEAAEIARLLGCTANAVWVRLSRARAAAHAVLERLTTEGSVQHGSH